MVLFVMFYLVTIITTMMTRMRASISREVIDMSSNFTVFDIISIPQSRQLSTCCYLTNISLVHISPTLGENPKKIRDYMGIFPNGRSSPENFVLILP